MYITILDYSEGKVYAVKVPDATDVEAYVDEFYGLSNTSYMVTDQLNLEVTYI